MPPPASSTRPRWERLAYAHGAAVRCPFMTLLGIAVAGALGALARFGMSGLVHRFAGAGFPAGTLAVNLIGCFLLGTLVGMGQKGGAQC